MSVQQTPRPAIPVGTIVMLAVAALVYIGMMVSLRNVGPANTYSLDAQAFGALFAIVLWIVLAMLFLLGSARGRMPAWSAMVAVLLVPMSGYSALHTIGWLGYVGAQHYQLVPGLLGFFLGFYALWIWLPSLHCVMSPLPTSLAVWTAISFLTLAPLIKPMLLLYLPWW